MRFRDEMNLFAEQFDVKPQVLSDSVIAVELPRDAARRQGNVRTFLLAVNLLSRTFDDVHVVFPAGTAVHRHPWHLDTVDAVIDELSNTVDGTLRVGPPVRSDVVLSIGKGPSLLADRQVHGEAARISTRSRPRSMRRDGRAQIVVANAPRRPAVGARGRACGPRGTSSWPLASGRQTWTDSAPSARAASRTSTARSARRPARR